MIQGLTSGVQSMVPAITEDTMPGELSNIIAGRVANVFNFTGPNFVTDAACASSLAALQSAVDGLRFGQFDAVLTGGVDRNMGVESFVKFSKIGALSPDGSRPYAEGANGFVMGEGAAIFLLKRLVDAERDGDKIYAVIRAIGGSSDGKGKGITAPNPLGQQRAIQRAWKNAAVPLSSVGLIEGHGTSTPVGDLAEVNSLNVIFGQLGLKPGSVALGSVKSNFGHLKSSAGAAGLLKTTLALYDHVLPASVNFNQPNSRIDFSQFALLCQHADARLGSTLRRSAPGRRQRLWFWRHQLPRGHGRIPAGGADKRVRRLPGSRSASSCPGRSGGSQALPRAALPGRSVCFRIDANPWPGSSTRPSWAISRRISARLRRS